MKSKDSRRSFSQGCAVSSVVEHFLDTEGVAGSNPASRTIKTNSVDPHSVMQKKVRWGVIASGGIARRRTIPEGIVPARNAELVAVYGRNTGTNTAVARQFGTRAVENLDELLALDLDAVYIASPNHAHLEQTRRAAAAGKHVFCEKPLGMNVVEARRMVQVCRKAGVNLGTAFMMRYHSQHQSALRLIQDGRLGKPVYARAQLSCWYPP